MTKKRGSSSKRVTPVTHPNLDWAKTAPGTWVYKELIQSDAFRSLSKSESDIFLFMLTLRKYPSYRKKGRNYWEPTNRDHLCCPGIAIKDFFDGKVKGMFMRPPSAETVRRAFRKFMYVGFLSLKHLGGNGPGDQSIYQLENNWRLWRKGDPPCYEMRGMSRAKGFIAPGSGVFNNSKRPQKNE